MKTKATLAAILSLAALAGCETDVAGSAQVEAGLSYDDFQRTYGVDQATMLAIDANNDRVISENEWQAAGY